MLIMPAHAAQGGAGGFDLLSFAPLLLMFVVLYFFILRPQQKKNQQHKSMIDALKIGDYVITSAGLLGLVKKIPDEKTIHLELSEDTQVCQMKSSIIEVIDKETAKKMAPVKKSMMKKATAPKAIATKKAKASS